MRFIFFNKYIKINKMQPLSDPELIKKFCATFPKISITNLTKLFDNDEFICYKDAHTNKNYLYDIKLHIWINDVIEYWRNVPLM
jgi:hypothetical protein